MSAVPISIRQSKLHVMGVDLVVHHLDNGQRIIEADSMAALFGAMERGEALDADAAAELAKALQA